MPFLSFLPPQDANHNSASLNQTPDPKTIPGGLSNPRARLPPLVHDASWDQICHPVLVLPHLALLYSCSIQILSLTSTFISQSLPARSCKHVSHPLLHSGASPIAAQSQTFPSSPTPADWRRPHWKHGAENITAGGFLQCEPNKTQTLPNNCYLQLK